MKHRGVKPIVFKATQRYYHINNAITLVDGLIDQNPFYKTTSVYRRSVMWVVNNREMVFAKIYKELKSPKIPKLGYGVTVDDIYGFILNYYMENADKDFQQNYMGRDSEYTTAAYILSNVKHLIFKFINDDDMSIRKFGDVASIVTGSEEFTPGQSTVHESSVKGTDDSDEWMSKGYYIECFEYLYVITNDLLKRSKPLTPDCVFDLYFHSLLEITPEQVQDRYQLTRSQWVRYLDKIKGIHIYTEDIKAMLNEIAGPAERGILRVEDVKHISI